MKTKTTTDAPPVGSSALFSDSERLEWVIATKASVTVGERMTTRKWPPTKDNLERVYQCEWWSKNGDLVMQSVDARHLTIREAIDAAMISENAKGEARR